MKRFTVPCDFGGKKAPFHLYIGEPHPKSHPLQNQAHWLSKERGGTIPQEVMEAFEKLHKISIDNNVSFEELCVYALGAAYKASDDKPGESNSASNATKKIIGDKKPMGAAPPPAGARPPAPPKPPQQQGATNPNIPAGGAGLPPKPQAPQSASPVAMPPKPPVAGGGSAVPPKPESLFAPIPKPQAPQSTPKPPQSQPNNGVDANKPITEN